MPTTTVNVNTIAGDTTSFNVNAATILSRASDGDTGTTFANNVGNVSLTFGLQDITDLDGLPAGATLNSIRPVVFAQTGGKGTANFSMEILNSDGEVQGDSSDASSSEAEQAEFLGSEVNISSFTSDQFNGLLLRYTTTDNTLVVASRIFATLDYSGAAGNGLIKHTSGFLKLRQGKITL